MNPSRLLGAVFACVIMIALSTSANAAVIFSQSQTGAQLNANTDVTYPNSPTNTANPTVSGSSLDFINTTNGAYSVLMRWDLLAAAPRGGLTINMDADYNVTPGGPSDNDPIFAIQAGSNFFGILRSDNSPGKVFGAEGSINTTAALSVSTSIMFDGLGVLDSMSWDMTIPDAAAGPQTILNFTEAAQSAAGPFSFSGNLLNSDDALAFVLIGNSVNVGSAEQYRINSVSVTIDELASAVPVPAAAWLFGSGLLGLVGMARRKKT